MTKTCFTVATVALIMSFCLPAYHVWVLEPELQQQIQYHFIQPTQKLLRSEPIQDPQLARMMAKGQQQLTSLLTTSSWFMAVATCAFFVVQLLLLLWVWLSTAKKLQAEQKMQRIADYDALTQTPNRVRFQHDLSDALKQHHEVGVLIIDLARFKIFKDSLGYDVGNSILIEMSRRIQSALHRNKPVYRLGADSFGIIVPRFIHANRLTLMAAEILRKIRTPYTLQSSREVSNQLTITGQIGIAVSTIDSRLNAQDLQRHAEIALALSVEKGGDHFHFFADEMMQQRRHQVEIEEQLYHALQHDQLVLHYQPQLDLMSNSLCGLEALLRWHHPHKGLTYPDAFIAIAERSGLIIEIGNWALKTACRQAERWRRHSDDLTMAVNISSQQFAHNNFIQSVDQILASTGFPPHLLKLELTETTMLENGNDNLGKIQALKQRGIQLSIDDFGTGYSSLSYLKNFPVDQIKIDRSFISHLLSNKKDAALVETIITIGQKLDIDVIAEGVEHPEQSTFLARHGCQKIQGYLVSKPIPAERLEALLKDETNKRARQKKNYLVMPVAS